MAQSTKTSFDEIIKEMTSGDTEISVDHLTRRQKYEKRRIYDLLNVLCALEICTKVDRKNYVWIGVDNIKEVLIDMARKLEMAVMECDDLSVLRICESAHLSMVVNSFIWAYLYFGVNVLNVQQTARLLANGNGGAKRVLRRLYLVTQILDRVNIVIHTERRGEYKLTFNVNEIVEEAFRRMKASGEFPPDSILAKMNEIDSRYISCVHQERSRRASARGYRSADDMSEAMADDEADTLSAVPN